MHTFLFQFIDMASDDQICIICKVADDKVPGLKPFRTNTWETIRNAATNRKALESDTFSNVTGEITSCQGSEGKYYHSVCLSRYAAVKKKNWMPVTSLLNHLGKQRDQALDFHLVVTQGSLVMSVYFVENRGKEKARKVKH